LRFRSAAPAALIAAVAVVVVGAAIVSNRMFAGMTATVERSQFDLMEKILDRSLKGAAGKAQARAELVASLPATRRLLAAKDRDGLLAEYTGMFEVQHARHEVDQMMFAVPPATVIARLNAPSAPIEDVSGFRPLVLLGLNYATLALAVVMNLGLFRFDVVRLVLGRFAQDTIYRYLVWALPLLVFATAGALVLASMT